MNIHLPAILMFTRGTRFWHTAKWGKTIHGNVWKRQRKSSGCHSFGALAVSYGTLSCCMCQEYHRSLWWAWWLRLPTDARRWAISKNWSGDGKLLTIWSDLGRCWPSRIRMIRWVAKSAKWHLANSWSLMSLDLPPGWFQCLTYSLPQGTRSCLLKDASKLNKRRKSLHHFHRKQDRGHGAFNGSGVQWPIPMACCDMLCVQVRCPFPSSVWLYLLVTPNEQPIDSIDTWYWILKVAYQTYPSIFAPQAISSR